MTKETLVLQTHTPYFLVQKDIVRNHYATLKSLGFTISYTAKANPVIVPLLVKLGSWCSVHSSDAISVIPTKQKIWYIVQGADDKELRKVMQQGITHFSVDNHQDFETFFQVIKGKEKKMHLLLRMQVPEASSYPGYKYPFGFPQHEIQKFVILARKKGCKRVGIHFHVGTQNIRGWSTLKKLIPLLRAIQPDIINIGGGIPVPYTTIINYKSIFHELKSFKEKVQPSMLPSGEENLFLEPGRFLAAEAVDLVTSIRAVVDKTVMVDASCYNASMDTLIAGLRLPCTVLTKQEADKKKGSQKIKKKVYIIKGCTACSLDIFHPSYQLPLVQRGDILIFHHAGAYNFGSDFMHLPKIPHYFF
ncbi:hypothetical protein HYW21_00255 [Candidatus Woesearchaeota archaeon]|nr:hypothetical protein [Candidatus Woesearchaeota archaeon]